MIGQIVGDGAKRMQIILPETAEGKIDLYFALLTEANARMNLARVISDPEEAADVHFLDALAPLANPGLICDKATLLDVGSGAGFPGIVLSIARPDMRVTLVDALKKRVDFLNIVIRALELNAEALHMRAEDAARMERFRESFDAVTARAVADLSRLSEWTIPFARIGGRVIAYKGPAASDEISRAATLIRTLGGGPARVVPIAIPNRTEWRHALVVIEKVKSTPERYPLRPPARKKTSGARLQ